MTTGDDDMRRAAAEANRALGVAGHSDMIWGHASVRDPAGRGVWMKATGWSFAEVTEQRIVLVSPDGEILDGDEPRHAEYPIHTELMAARPDIQAVVHSHAIHAVTFASLDLPLRSISHDAVPFTNPDIPRFTRSGALITDSKMGALLAETLGDAPGALIPGHGFVTVGETPAVAVMRAVLLDRACRLQLIAIQAGGPSRWSDDEEVAVKKTQTAAPHVLASGYEYLVRRARENAFPVMPI